MSDPWPAFVASLNPADLESERFRMPSLDERPGSAADRWQRDLHEVRRARFAQRGMTATVGDTRAALIESMTWRARRSNRVAPVDEQTAIEKAIAEYKKTRSK